MPYFPASISGMDAKNKDLKSRYRKAVRRVERENDIIHRSRDRKIYWQKISKDIEKRLNLATEGQLEFKALNQGEV